MALDEYKTKKSVVIVYTGEGKGKTSAAIGLLARALGNGYKCAFVQFMKSWEVSEHKFIDKIGPHFKDQLAFYKGGKGFYNLGKLSAKNVDDSQHKQAAQSTYSHALDNTESGEYDLVICDEAITALNEGLLSKKQIQLLINNHHQNTSLCLTGRGFPVELLDNVDIATNMTKLKHHFDDQFQANKGIDY